jgi:hypothetical protein
VLVVQSLPGFALELNYEAPRLVERVNGYFGYGAISSIKVVQGQIADPAARQQQAAAPLSPPEAAKLDERLAGIAQSGLKDALVRLATSLKSRRPA